MSAICPTCNSRLSCGCQRKTASNGVQVCTLCIGRVEADIVSKKAKANSTPGAPTNMNANYSPPK